MERVLANKVSVRQAATLLGLRRNFLLLSPYPGIRQLVPFFAGNHD